MRNAEDIEYVDDILNGKSTVLSVGFLWKWLTEVRVNVGEQFPRKPTERTVLLPFRMSSTYSISSALRMRWVGFVRL